MFRGANMAQRTLNARWYQYDAKDIKCQMMPPPTDIVSVVMVRAILASPDFRRLMCQILAPPGPWCCMCHVP